MFWFICMLLVACPLVSCYTVVLNATQMFVVKNHITCDVFYADVQFDSSVTAISAILIPQKNCDTMVYTDDDVYSAGVHNLRKFDGNKQSISPVNNVCYVLYNNNRYNSTVVTYQIFPQCKFQLASTEMSPPACFFVILALCIIGCAICCHKNNQNRYQNI